MRFRPALFRAFVRTASKRDANERGADLAETRQRSSPVTTALVLSGGASLGAVQVGMLKALTAHDVRPDLIVGTSVGAINGAFRASRPFDSDTVDELAELWLGVSRGRVFPIEPLTGCSDSSARERISCRRRRCGGSSSAMWTSSGSRTFRLRCTSSRAT